MPLASDNPSLATEAGTPTVPAAMARLSRRSSFWIVAYGLALYVPFLGSNRVLTLHEVLFAQPAREMLASGDWILTTYGGIPFNHKPPLTYWLLAVVMGVTNSANEWLIRLPFALTTLATAWIIAWLVARWHGDGIGRLAGLVQLTTYYMLMQGRLAESDILLCFLVTAAYVVFAYANVASPAGPPAGGRWSPVFYALAGLAFLTKGPVALAFILGGTGLITLFERRWRDFGFYFHPLGLLVFFPLCLAWPIAAYRADPQILETWKMHHLGRYLGEMGGTKPPLFYVYTTLYMLLPWTPAVALGIWWGKTAGLWRSTLWRLMAAWFAFGLLVLSGAVWQYKHYLIPVLPPLSVFAAYGAGELLHRRPERPLRGLAWIGLTLVVVTMALVGARLLAPELAWHFVPATLLLAGGLAWTLYLYGSRKSSASVVTALAGTALVIVWTVQFQLIPRFDSYYDQTWMARRANEAVPPEARIDLVALPDNQITFYLKQPLARYDEVEAFLRSVVATGEQARYVVGPRSLAQTFAEMGAVVVRDQCAELRRHMKPEDRITLFELRPNATWVSRHSERLTR